MSKMTTEPLLFAGEDLETGGKGDESVENDFAYRNNVKNASVKIRMGFLRKVYGLITIQLLITVAVAAVCMFCTPVKRYVQENGWMVGLAFILTLVMLVALHVKRRDHPTNLILLGAFTLVQAYTVGTIVSKYDAALVLEALGITLVIVFSLTVYTLQSKRDFSFLGFGLFAGLVALLVGGIIQIFVQSTILELSMGIGGALLFAVFIIFDTHMLMTVLSPEEYILAAINIYLDIINLFLHILRALAASQQ